MQPRKLHCCMMKILNKTESPIFVLLCVLCFQRQPLKVLFYFTAAGVKRSVAAVKYLPVLHHCADYILNSFGIMESILILVTLKIQYRLSRR